MPAPLAQWNEFEVNIPSGLNFSQKTSGADLTGEL